LKLTFIVGHFLMQVFTPQTLKTSFPAILSTPEVLGNSLTLDLEKFPELDWLPGYLAALNTLQKERDRLTEDIRAIEQEGEVSRNQWIEPYIKTKNGKKYSYYQLRWLTGERKKSDQPKVKTKHLSHKVVGEVRAAIERGHQVEALESQQRRVGAKVTQLKRLVQGTSRRLKDAISQN
jgi:hypothetical protein